MKIQGWAGLALSCLAACDAGSDIVLGTTASDAAKLDSGVGDGSTMTPHTHDRDTSTASCAWADVITSRLPVTTWFVIDHSAKMGYVQPPTWPRVREALVGAEGIVTQNQSTFSFGAVVHGGDSRAATCPVLGVAEPKLDNRAAIEGLLSVWPASGAGAQGGYALEQIRLRMQEHPPVGPQVVVKIRYGGTSYDLACVPSGTSNSLLGRQQTYDEATLLAERNVKLFVVDFTPPVDRSEPEDDPQMLQQSRWLAEIGNTSFPPFYFGSYAGDNNQDELVVALRKILAESVSCEFELNGAVKEGMECDGEVSIDGTLRTCDDPDGWRMKDASTVEFTGKACADLREKQNAQVKARFSCESFIVF